MKVREAVAHTQADLRDLIQKTLKKRPMTAGDLADVAHCSEATVKHTIKEMQRGAVSIVLRPDGHYDSGAIGEAGHIVLKSADRGDGWMPFGVTTDNHLGNVHSRLDVLNSLYDEFAREGVKYVFNAGNAIDGEMRFNKRELIVRPGMDAQIDYWVENMPQRDGMVTYFATGDDHEGWYAQRECINIGDYMQMRAQKAGRNDLIHIGYGEADVEFKNRGGSIVGKVMHPGGGSAYAYSYTSQKIVESLQGGEKPAFILGGHYHKYDSCYPRNVWFVQCGCTCDQTLFMRKKKIEGHVGGVLGKIRQDKTDGHLEAFEHRFIPFFDRGFYERRFE